MMDSDMIVLVVYRMDVLLELSLLLGGVVGGVWLPEVLRSLIRKSDLCKSM